MFNFNFYGWGFNMSNLDDLLSKQQITTDQILDHDNIVSEVKQSSTKFGNFIKKRPVLIKKMIDYIFMNEKESLTLGFNDPKKCNKYPYISSEILGCENPGIMECFFQEFNKQNQLTKNQQEDDLEENGEQQHKRDDDDEDEDDDEDDEYENNNNRIKLKNFEQENKKQENQEDEQENQNEKEHEEEQFESNNENQKENQDDNQQSEEQEQQVQQEKLLEEQDNQQKIWEENQQKQDEIEQLKENESTDNYKDVENSYALSSSNKAAEEFEIEDDTDDNYYFKGCLLDYLMNKFSQSKNDINTTCIGYLQRILNALINKNGLKFFEYVLPKQKFIFSLLENLNSRSMAEILTRFIIIDFQDIENQQHPFFIEERRLIMDCLLKRFQESRENEELENISYIFTEVIIKIDKCLNSKKILEFICSPNNLEIIFEKMLDQVDDQYNTSFISYSSQILKQLLTLFLKPQSQDEQRYSEENSPAKQSDDDMVVTNNSKDHVNYIQQDNFQNLTHLINFYGGRILELLDQNTPNTLTCVDPYINQSKEKMVPLGLGKFQLVEFIEVCIRVNDNEQIQSSLIQNNVFKVLLNLMLRYPYHNLLHNVIISIIEQQIFNDHENNQVYLKNLFEEVNFLEFLKEQLIGQYYLSDNSNTIQQFEAKNKIFGQLFKLVRKLYKEQEKNDNDRQKEILNYYIYSKSEWKELKDQLITKLDNFYNKDIAGENPRIPKNNNNEENMAEDKDDQQVLLEIQKIYQKFNHYNFIKSNNDEQDDGEIEEKERLLDQNDNEIHENDQQNDNNEDLKYNDLESDNNNQQNETQAEEQAEINEQKEENAYLSSKYWDNKDLNTYNLDDLIKEL